MASAVVRDVASAGFDEQVIRRSFDVPVLVDFWAAWCGPCRVLGPVLEKLANEQAGRFELVKVDTDANQDLAMTYQIRGIPAVKLFVGGKVAAEFVGALPESAVREFLAEHCPSETDELVRTGLELLEAGDLDGAGERLRKALETGPDHPGAHLGIARIELAAGNVEAVARHVAAIGALADEAETAKYLGEASAFVGACEQAGGEQACRDRLESDADDLDARFALGACLASRGRYREALEEFLAVVAKDRRHNDEAARKAMLTVFGVVGIRSDLSDEFRRKLSVYL